MPGKHRKLSMKEIFVRFIFITAGAILAGVALEIFLVPNNIIDGGITGISIMMNQLTELPLGLFLFVLNLPFLIIGYKQVGKTFAFSSLYGIVVLSLTTTILHHVEAFTQETILAVLFGGLLLGLGVGLVLRFSGSTDGAEILAILISKKTNMPVGQIILITNVLIFIVAGFYLGWDSAMYSIFTYYIASKVMDIVVEGLDESKSVTIISKEYEEISQAIMDRLGRSTTFMYARGGYTKEDTQVVYCVVSRLELAKLKAIVTEIDRNAFLAVEHVSDVSGGNFAKKSIH
ncbi:YitT family protein [Paenibacillus physcomitrellae]|uniref:Membrane protein n=1 Tax=Paenibacillus physcomitrellae TaxID=1619311 RepID=A0ABQ1FMN1_9BACL|nr:YitT family protein [Paenibacillus physcomitrellae]GGA21275.1 membrane protein [Paenibacillus physcomitrellae]